MGALLEIRDLVTRFYTYEGVVQALDGVSLTVERGATFGLVGESGCGKSVTVRSILRIVSEPGRIEGGEIIFYPDAAQPGSGVDLLRQSERFMQTVRGGRISMIFQEPGAALNPTLRIGDQVGESFLFHRRADMCRRILSELAPRAGRGLSPLRPLLRAIYAVGARKPEARLLKVLDRVPVLKGWQRRLKAEAWQRAIDIVGKLGIPNPAEVVRQYPHQLSGGMKQRIVIAIALACEPLLLIADEATSNLDVTIQAQILDLLQRLKQEVIASVLLITHDLGVVAETCDRVGVMYAGNLCEVADVRELFGRPLHPYTRALLDAVPKFSMEGELAVIDGTVPNLVDPPPGCRFHPRCRAAMAVCRTAVPAMATVGPGHQVACYLYTHRKRSGSP